MDPIEKDLTESLELARVAAYKLETAAEGLDIQGATYMAQELCRDIEEAIYLIQEFFQEYGL